MRVVLDTNVAISPFLSPKGVPALIFKAWEKQVIDLVVSNALLSEYERVLSYPEVVKYHKMSEAEIILAIDRFKKFGIYVSIHKIPNVIKRDPSDNHVLAAAVEGEASFIVTKDKDLLSLEEYQGIQILPPPAFLEVLKEG